MLKKDLKETNNKINIIDNDYQVNVDKLKEYVKIFYKNDDTEYQFYLNQIKSIVKAVNGNYEHRLKYLCPILRFFEQGLIESNDLKGFQMGKKKYSGNVFSWQNSDILVYINALIRHWIASFYQIKDEEGYKHHNAMVTNVRFIRWYVEKDGKVEYENR